MRRRRLKPEKRVVSILSDRGLTLAVAESCTGGLVGYRITSVPGSSVCFRGAVVAYDNSVKRKVLGVGAGTLRRHGAVSAETAVEMARGVRRALGARIGVSVTGIAGPTGGTADKPVGLVCIALSAGRRDVCVEHRFRGGRENVRRRAADVALSLLLSYVDE
jgi:nicotinamide-nucleotide amidase